MNTTLGHRLSWLCFLWAAGFLAAALYFATMPTHESPFLIEPLERDLGAIPVGTHTVAFTFTNPEPRPRRIIGLAEG